MELCFYQKAIIFLSILFAIIVIGIISQIAVVAIIGILGVIISLMTLLSKWYGKTQEKKKKRNALLISELQKFMEQTIFPNMKYNWVKVKAIDYKEAELEYRNEVLKVLKEHGAYTLLEKGKEISESLKTDGIEAIENFHRMVKKQISGLSLEKLLEIGRTLSVPYYSVPRVHESIFEEISGEHFKLCVTPESSMISVIIDNKKTEIATWSLCHGDARLAKGKEETMNQLEEIIESLMRNKKVRKEIEIYKKAKEKLDSGEPFSEFEDELTKIIAELRWNQ